MSTPLTPDATQHHTPTATDGRSRQACEQMFVACLPLIRRVTAAVARRYRLSPDEAEEFGAATYLRIIRDDYAVFRKFRGGCTLRTFLTVVIQRMCLDYRNAQWGKWRASRACKRHGETAVLLERLTMRDGLTFDEACAEIEASHGSSIDRSALGDIYAQCRKRGRPRFTADDSLDEVAAPEKRSDEILIDAEARRIVAGATDILAGTLATIAAEDRLILKLRFVDALSVADIGRMLGLDQHALYGRLARLHGSLRRLLESRGVCGADVLAALGRGPLSDVEIFADSVRGTATEPASSRIAA